MEMEKHVLLVTNATNDTEVNLIKNAFSEAKNHNLKIKLTLVHVIPGLPTCYFNIPSMVLLTERYYDEAREYLATIGQTFNVSEKDQWLITGRLKIEVQRLAHKLNAQFILASSVTIPELHNPSFAFSKGQNASVIKNISNIGNF